MFFEKNVNLKNWQKLKLKQAVTPATAQLGLNQDFVGLTIIAFVPAFTEFVGNYLNNTQQQLI